MKEEHIVRTTVYLPKSHHKLLKAKGINLSRAVRQLATELLNESEEERLRQEIQELENALMEKKAKLEYIIVQRKQKQEVEESLMKVAEKLAEWLTQRYKFWKEKTEFEAGEREKLIEGTVEVLKRDYGIYVDGAFISALFENAFGSDKSSITPQDVMHLIKK